MLTRLREADASAAFNRWAGFEVTAASEGGAEVELAWRDDFGQYLGFMHAGMVGALIDTACGYAAATVAGRVLASQYQVAFHHPAQGARFRAVGRVDKAGKRLIFASADLYVIDDAAPRRVAAGSAILAVAP